MSLLLHFFSQLSVTFDASFFTEPFRAFRGSAINLTQWAFHFDMSAFTISYSPMATWPIMAFCTGVFKWEVIINIEIEKLRKWEQRKTIMVFFVFYEIYTKEN